MDGFVQAAGEVVFGIVAQEAARLGDVGVGMLDVAETLGAEARLDVLAQRPGEGVVDVDEVFAAAVGDVEGLPTVS